jgi:hypothetical protein
MFEFKRNCRVRRYDARVEVRAQLRQVEPDRWVAVAETEPPIRTSGASSERCLAALRRALRRAGMSSQSLTVHLLPRLAGVAEAASIMGWDKRRVITYIDRGSFPEPVQALAAGRVWLRDDIERFAREWRARRAARQ